MALTYTPTQALNYAKRFCSNAPIDDSDLSMRILNSASNRIHLFAPWSWSVAEHTQVDIANGMVDYTVADNSSTLLYLIKSELSRDDSKRDRIQVVHSLPANIQGAGSIAEVALTSNTNLRVSPIPKYDSNDLPRMFTWYKKRNTVITSGNAGTASTLLFPDEWFWVFEEFVLLYAMRFSDANSNRVGDILVSGNSIRHNGQHGVAQEALLFMAAKEKPFLLDLGDPVNG